MSHEKRPLQTQPPQSDYVGVGSDGVSLEIPKYIPIFKEPPTGIVVPKATPLNDPSSVSIQFRIPQGTFGPMVILGMWAILAIPGTGANANEYPLIYADPDAGIMSDSSGTPTAPPGFVGPQEGCNFLYTLKIRDVVVAQYHHAHFKDNWRLLSMPIEVPDGANGELIVQRLDCSEFADGETVYLFAGIFGRQRQIIPPPFHIDSCNQPVRPVAYTSGRLTVPTSTAGTGIMGPTTSVPLVLTNRHPTIIDEVVYSGMQHVYIKYGYELGNFMTDWVPSRLLNFLHSGRTPAPILMNAPSRVTFELAQPLIVANQPVARAAIDIAGGSYGW